VDAGTGRLKRKREANQTAMKALPKSTMRLSPVVYPKSKVTPSARARKRIRRIKVAIAPSAGCKDRARGEQTGDSGGVRLPVR
jgi:hypothetical protein